MCMIRLRIKFPSRTPPPIQYDLPRVSRLPLYKKRFTFPTQESSGKHWTQEVGRTAPDRQNRPCNDGRGKKENRVRPRDRMQEEEEEIEEDDSEEVDEG
jgi:hypothetical protein